MTERWLPVVGSDNRYEVSDQGRVRSLYSKTGLRKEPLLMSNRASGNWYPKISICMGDGSKTMRNLHSLVSEAFLGPRPKGMEVRHLNGQKNDNRLENLVYGTPKENQADKRLHGTQPLGPTHPLSKLSYIKAEAVRELYATGRFGYSDLADVFEVGSGSIRKIISGGTWRDEDAPKRQPV